MTTIGATLTITGELSSQEDVTVHGTVTGQIQMENGAFRVAPEGRVDAQVRGGQVTIEGTFDGAVVATTRLELTSTAKTTGVLTAPALVLHDGAVFNGSINSERAGQSKGKNQAGLKLADGKAAAQAV